MFYASDYEKRLNFVDYINSKDIDLTYGGHNIQNNNGLNFDPMSLMLNR